MNNYTRRNNNINRDMAAFDDLRHHQADSQVLQEIIDILKHPFQTSCDHCNGLGFIRSGEDCITCRGTGKVIDRTFK